MKTLMTPLVVLVLAALVFNADTAITHARAGSVLRAICYGAVAVLALLSLVVAFGLFQ